jgi:DNA repair exonuclease SbcCD nuclease subunit
VYQFQALADMLHYCERNDIRTLFFGGDMCHTFNTLTATVQTVLSNFILEMKRRDISLYGVAGNHDFGNKSGSVHSLSMASLIDGVSIAPHILNDCGIFPRRVYMLGYHENRDLLLRNMERAPNESILFLHQGMLGADVGNGFVLPNEIIRPEDIPDHVALTLLGHYHKEAQVAPKAHFIGAMSQHTWGDSGQWRGFIDLNLETLVMKRIESSSPKFIVTDKPLPDEETRGNFVRVTDPEIKVEGAEHVEPFLESLPTPSINSINLSNLSIESILERYAEIKGLDSETVKIGRSLIRGD